MIKSIPLNKLVQSPRNVRRHDDPAADAELKASIAAHGLLQNLIVRPAAKGIHGGDTKGVDRLASSWAERRGIPQVTFSLDMRLGARAGFKRNERMLSLEPRYVIAFPGTRVAAMSTSCRRAWRAGCGLSPLARPRFLPTTNRLLLRDSKTGPRTVWLGSAAREVIDGLPRHPKIPWLFWNYQYRRPISCIRHLWGTILERTNLGRLRIHDLRHTFASHAAMGKETLPMIGRLLGHANHQSTARYAHFDDEHLLDAAQQVGDAVQSLLA